MADDTSYRNVATREEPHGTPESARRCWIINGGTVGLALAAVVVVAAVTGSVVYFTTGSDSILPSVYPTLGVPASLEVNETICEIDDEDRHGLFRSFLHSAQRLQEITSQIDWKADPCGGFYEFACSRYIASVNYTQQRSSLYSFAQVDDLVSKNVKILLESPVRDNETDWNKFVKTTYAKCIQEATSPQESSDIVRFLKEMAKPLLEGSSPSSDIRETLRSTNHKYLQQGLFTWSLEMDSDRRKRIHVNKPSVNARSISGRLDDIYIYLPSNVLPLGPLAYGGNDYRYYYKYMVEILTLLGANRTTAERLSADVIRFESEAMKKVISAQWSPAYLGNGEWLIDLEYYGGKDLTQNNSLRVSWNSQYSNYFDWLRTRLRTEPAVVHYHLMWRAIDYFVPVMPYEFREVLAIFAKNDATNLIIKDPAESCREEISRSVNFPVAHMVVDEFFDSKSSAELDDMIQNVVRTFTNLVQSLKYPTKKMRQEAENWVNNVTVFSDLPDILKEAALESINPDVDDTFLGHFFHAKEYLAAKKASFLIQNISTLDWFERDFLTTNAFYKFPENVVQINAASLSPPLFDGHQLPVLNYAGLGSVISHELTHSFFHFLISQKKYVVNIKREAMACLIKQYSSRVDFGIHSESPLTAEEDFADNGGLVIAYNAFLQRWPRFTYHSQVSSIDDKKLFFITYARTWCENPSEAALKAAKTGIDYHSAGRFRVSIPLHNLDDFSEAFNCTASAGDSKCCVW